MAACSGGCCTNHVNCCSCTLKQVESWTKSLRSFPKITPFTWAEWLRHGSKKNAGEKSYKFFREGYVFGIHTATVEDNSGHERQASGTQGGLLFHVKGRCYRSLRKSEDPHHLFLSLSDSEGQALVCEAHCSWKGGSGGHCNHVFVLLFQLNDYSCLEIKDIPSDKSCTSRPQTWHIPRATSICPLPVMAIHYARAATDQDGARKRDPVKCKLYDARGPDAKAGLSSCHVMDHVSQLKRQEKPPPFSYLLSDQEPTMLINTVFGNMPLGSCLSYQLQDFGRPNTRFIHTIKADMDSDINANNTDTQKFVEFPAIPLVKPIRSQLTWINYQCQASLKWM